MKLNRWFAAMAFGLFALVLSQADEETPAKPSDVSESLRDFVVNRMAKGAPVKFFKLDSAPPEQKWRVEYFRGKPLAYLLQTREVVENGKTNTVVVRAEALKTSNK